MEEKNDNYSSMGSKEYKGKIKLFRNEYHIIILSSKKYKIIYRVQEKCMWYLLNTLQLIIITRM